MRMTNEELAAIEEHLDEYGDLLEAHAEALLNEVKRLRDALSQPDHEVGQTLGRALGYPWYKDDQKNFPGATEADGVCVGDHVPESLASEAAQAIEQLQQQRDKVGKLAADWGVEANKRLLRAEEAERQVTVLERLLPRVLPDCFICPEHGPFVAVDEDGCCTTCGADTEVGRSAAQLAVVLAATAPEVE